MSEHGEWEPRRTLRGKQVRRETWDGRWAYGDEGTRPPNAQQEPDGSPEARQASQQKPAAALTRR